MRKQTETNLLSKIKAGLTQRQIKRTELETGKKQKNPRRRASRNAQTSSTSASISLTALKGNGPTRPSDLAQRWR